MAKVKMIYTNEELENDLIIRTLEEKNKRLRELLRRAARKAWRDNIPAHIQKEIEN
jgi:hypothetical protein